MRRTSLRGAAGLASVALGAAALVTVSLASAAAPEAAKRSYTETRRAGQVDASFSYRDASDFGYERQRLVVDRGGRRMLDVYFTPENSNWPLTVGRSLALTDLDGGEPEVIVSLFTGGANCCYALRVYRFSGGRYRGSFFNSGNGGLTVMNIDHKGVPEIRSADGRFHYLFSSGADSFYPIRIFRFKAGKLVTVTRQFRYQMRQAEIRSWNIAREFWNDPERNPHTVLAAWAANKYLLGEGAEVWPRLEELIDSGTIEAEVEANGGPFLAELRKALREFGYRALPQQS
jgi:hypothetical protein